MDIERQTLLTALSFVECSPNRRRNRVAEKLNDDKGAELFLASQVVSVMVTAERVQFTKSDQDSIYARAEIAIPSMDEPFTTQVDFAALLTAVKAYSSEFVSLNLDKDRLILKSPKDKTTTKLVVQPYTTGEEPVLKGEPKTVAMPADTLQKAIKQVSIAAANPKDAREILKSIALRQGQSELSLLTSDGFMIAVCKISNGYELPEKAKPFTVNADAVLLSKLIPFFDDVLSLVFGAEQLDILGKSSNGVHLYAHLNCVSGMYPDLDQVMDYKNSKAQKFTVDFAQSLIKPALKQMSLFKDSAHVTIAKNEGGILLSSKDVTTGNGAYELACQTEGEFPILLHVNKVMLGKLLNAMATGNVKMEVYFTDTAKCVGSPVIFLQPNLDDMQYKAALMPMHVD